MQISKRNERGSQVVEFGAALSLLVSFVLVPVLNLSVIPLHWMMANEMINHIARKLAFSETFSQSCRCIQEAPTLAEKLGSIGGVKVDALDLHLQIISLSNAQSEFLEVSSPGQIPAAWLPDGSKSPCTYSLVLNVKLLLSPAFLIKGVGVPVLGFTAPVPVSILVSRQWENLGRDPDTGSFFVNE